MTVTMLHGHNPFEAIKQTHPSGAERWSARDLMPLMGYSSWRNFEVPIERAMSACERQGMDVSDHFARSRKMAVRVQGGGVDQADFILTRFAAYLVAMNGDPNKPQVAAAQTYFAVRTREAEVQETRALPQSFSEALRMLADECDAHELAKVRITELEPAAAAWDHMASSAGDWSVQQAAGILARDPSITLGRQRLFIFMESSHWIFRKDGHWMAYADKIDVGYLSHRAQHHVHPRTGEVILDPPQVRVTAKGLARLHKMLGGSEPLVAIPEAD